MIGKTRRIEKTRQAPSEAASAPATEPSAPSVPSAGKSRGVLGWPSEAVHLAVSRHLPPPELAECVAHYWTVSWDLRGREPHLQETLPHPNVYLVFEDGKLTVSGVSTRKFTRLLSGKARVFGVKFKPGGFHPFLQPPESASVSTLTDCVLPASHIFGEAADALEARLLVADGKDELGEEELVHAANEFLLARVLPPDDSIRLATCLVERIFAEPRIKTVEDLAERSGLGKRTLQRLFKDYVGTTPKWVIRRYRLHELVERLNSGEELDWPDLALDLGYFDQAHLINDFRSIVGDSPARYQQRLSPEAAGHAS